MNIKLKKSLRDLQINPWRTALVVLALVVGIWGVGSVLVTFTVLNSDLNENFLRTNPPHAVLTSKDFKNFSLAEFQKRPEIESAEFRDLSNQRIEVYPNYWIPLLVFGVEDFTDFKLARFYNENGKIIPETGTMLIERNGQLISNLKIGSSARVRIGSRIVNIPVSGINFDPAQAPATQDHRIYAYVDKKTYQELIGEKINQRLIYRLKKVNSKEEVKTQTDKIIDYFKTAGVSISSVDIPKFNEHPHQWQLNTLLFLQGSIGFLAFFMGAVLVSQLMAAILSRQVRQIGILKAIGASRLKIFRIYIIMVLALGVFSGIISIPLAVSSGYAFAYFVARTLNFEILTTSLPYYAYLYLIAAGILLPIILSHPAIMKGVNVSVQKAISDYGIPQVASRAKSSDAAGFSLPYRITILIRNTMRQKRRLAVTILAMALGAAIFSTGFNVRQSLVVLLDNVKDAMRYDVQVVFQGQLSREKALAYFKEIENVSRIESWNGGRGELQSKAISTSDGLGIIALPYNSGLINLKIAEGRWINSSIEPEIVMNQQALEISGNTKVGGYQDLNINGKIMKVKLVGIAEELDRPKMYMDEKLYDSFANPDHLVNSLMFIAKDNSYEKVISLKKEIEQAIDKSDFKILYVMSQAERVKIIYDHLSIILVTIVFFAFLVLFVSALGMASATSINIMERTREIGVLRAIGATPKMICSQFIAEGFVVSIISIVLGLMLSWPLSIAASSFFGTLMLGEGASLQFAFSKSGFIITLFTTIIFGYLASRIPARNAIKVSTREALAYE